MTDPALSFLLSTRAARPDSFERILSDLDAQTVGDFELVVVVQSVEPDAVDRLEAAVERYRDRLDVRTVVSDTVGLSVSRNIALAHARAPAALLCDDDCRYPEEAVEKILAALPAHPDWDILAFRMARPDGTLAKGYPEAPRAIGQRGIMHVSSVEIVIRRRLIREAAPLFDSRIGLGTPYVTGAENVMLMDALRGGYRIGFHPETIVSHPEGGSAHGGIDAARTLRSKAVMFRRMYGWLGALPAFLFFLRRLVPGKALKFRPGHLPALLEGLSSRRSPLDPGAGD